VSDEPGGAALDEIARRMKTGDPDAFPEFADTFGERLRWTYLRRGLSPADAESLAVSVVGDIVVKIDRFTEQGPGSFTRWANQVAFNALRDQFRHRLDLLDDPSAVADRADDPDAGSAELIQTVRVAIDGLDETDRLIVAARLDDPHQTYAQLGAQVGLEAGAARVRYHRALKKLAPLLEQYPVVRAWLAQLRPTDHPEG
jgi:RNA polymerase sigma factor (sigma-70 family)